MVFASEVHTLDEVALDQFCWLKLHWERGNCAGCPECARWVKLRDLLCKVFE
jgi:hypothetical protein